MPGRLEVITGPMFSGKTSELIARVRGGLVTGLRVRAYKPRIDNRYAESAIVSHTGDRIDATPVESAREVDTGVDLIGLDEVQFFPDVVPAIRAWVSKGIQVVVSGLDYTSEGEPFGPMPALLSGADHILRCQGTCARCGSPSTRTQRLIASQEKICIGGAEAYEPRCLSCFDPPRGKRSVEGVSEHPVWEPA